MICENKLESTYSFLIQSVKTKIRTMGVENFMVTSKPNSGHNILRNEIRWKNRVALMQGKPNV